MQGHFLAIHLTGYERGDHDYFRQARLPQEPSLRAAYLVGLIHERDRIRKDFEQEYKTLKWRSMTQAGQMIETPVTKPGEKPAKQTGQNEQNKGFLAFQVAAPEGQAHNKPVDKQGDKWGKFRQAAESLGTFMSHIFHPVQPEEEPDMTNVAVLTEARKNNPVTKPPPPAGQTANILPFNQKEEPEAGTPWSAYRMEWEQAAQQHQEEIYGMLENRIMEIVLQRMDRKVALARIINSYADELFDNEEDKIQAMSFILAEDPLIADVGMTMGGLLKKEADALRGRRHVYGRKALKLARQMKAYYEDPEYLEKRGCMTLTKTLARIKSYDLLFNRLRYASDLADKNTKERAKLIAFCNRLIEKPMEDTPGFSGKMEEEAQRVKEMIQKDLWTAPELKGMESPDHFGLST